MASLPLPRSCRSRCRRAGAAVAAAAAPSRRVPSAAPPRWRPGPASGCSGPMSGPAWSAPAATSQPRTSPTGIANASAASPPGSGTASCGVHPDAGAPASASMAMTSSPGAVGVRRARRPTPRPVPVPSTPGAGPRRARVIPRRVRRGVCGRRGAGAVGVPVRRATRLGVDHRFGGEARPHVAASARLSAVRSATTMLPLVARERAGAGEVLVGFPQQAEQRGAPPLGVGFEHLELGGRRDAVGLGAHVQIELPVAHRRGRGRLRHRATHSPVDPVGRRTGHRITNPRTHASPLFGDAAEEIRPHPGEESAAAPLRTPPRSGHPDPDQLLTHLPRRIKREAAVPLQCMRRPTPSRDPVPARFIAAEARSAVSAA